MHQVLGLISTPDTQGMVPYTCNPSMLEVEIEAEVGDHHQLQRVFETQLFQIVS